MTAGDIHHAAMRGFEAGVEHYQRGRPNYPDDAVTYLVQELGIGEGATSSSSAPGPASSPS